MITYIIVVVMKCLSAEPKALRFYSQGGLDIFVQRSWQDDKTYFLILYYNNLLFLSWFTSAASMPKINDQS